MDRKFLTTLTMVGHLESAAMDAKKLIVDHIGRGTWERFGFQWMW